MHSVGREEDVDVDVAGLGQRRSGEQSVSAVVSAAGQHENAPDVRTEFGCRDLRQRGGGTAHQRLAPASSRGCSAARTCDAV